MDSNQYNKFQNQLRNKNHPPQIEVQEDELFATSIYILTLPSYGTFNQQFTKYIYNLKMIDPEGSKKSNYGGWHSPNLKTNHPIFKDFFFSLDNIFTNLMLQLKWDLKNYNLGYKEVWAIINSKYSYNTIHGHGDALLSFAYYVKVPKDKKGGDIFFKDPRIGGAPNKPPQEEIKSKESFRLLGKTHSVDNMSYVPEEGKLIIFPGWLLHGVKQNLSDEDRIVISGNIKLYPKNK